MKLSVIILAMTTTEEQFKMTLYCIDSLIKSESDLNIEIIVVESNRDYSVSEFEYPHNVKVVVPESDFNFHKFLNIGISKATGDFIALCNNDLIFYKGWFNEIYQVARGHSKIMSFSPASKKPVFTKALNFELGYKVRTHVMGWCIVVRKSLFDTIGLLDEKFDFNYADNDYAMTLKLNNVKHAVVFNSYVKHVEREERATETGLLSPYELMIKKAELELDIIPQYIYSKEYQHFLHDKKGLLDTIKYHEKWGEPTVLYRLNRIADLAIKFKLGYCNHFIFHNRLVHFLVNLK
jgi:glycosyltransferase involved in cell wall biosynthesis